MCLAYSNAEIKNMHVCILKIGGSLLAPKDTTVLNREFMQDCATQLAQFQYEYPHQRLILLHGAGSVGHLLAQEYCIASEVQTKKQKEGFEKTRIAVREFNKVFMEYLAVAGVRAKTFSPGDFVEESEEGSMQFDVVPIITELQQGTIPVLYGDMIRSEKSGGRVLSMDEGAVILANRLHISKLFFATDVAGVYDDDPKKYPNAHLLQKINVQNVQDHWCTAQGADVTGAMGGKLTALKKLPQGSTVFIFDGRVQKVIIDVLRGASDIQGTSITV